MREMFKTLAPFYDLVKSHRDYEREARDIRAIIGRAGSGSGSMLELACGTGSLLRWFEDYERVGLDISPEMLAIARTKLGAHVALHHADLGSFHLGRQFDSILLLDGAIGYVPGDDLSAAVGVFCKHMSRRGLLIIEPWFTPSEWLPGQTRVVSHSDDLRTIVRVSFGHNDGTIDFHNVIGTATGIQTFDEQYRFYLHTRDQLSDALLINGADPRSLAESASFRRGLVVATMH